MDWYRSRTVLITGASGGIGEHMARLLAPHHTTLLLTARSEGALQRVAEECRGLGAEAQVFTADLGETGAAQALYDRIAEAGLAVDVLINNAGFGLRGAVAEQDPEELDSMLTLNVTTLVGLTSRFLPAMIARGGGGVLNVSSTASFIPTPYFAAYAASKSFVTRFTQALHEELRGTGVHASCLSPGPTDTGFFKRAGMSSAAGGAVSSPERVAREGLEALARNRRVAVSGRVNWVLGHAARLAPTALALAAGGWMMERTA